MKNNHFSGSSLFISLFLFIVLISFNACKKSDENPNVPANEVWMMSSSFTPSIITISVNTTVKWINKDGIAHTVTSNTPGLFDSGSMSANGTFSHQFTSAGTYDYKCTFHPGMTGKVIVN